MGDARRDTSGLKHPWSHDVADDADAADVDADEQVGSSTLGHTMMLMLLMRLMLVMLMQAPFSLNIVTLCSDLVRGGFAVLMRAVVLYVRVVLLCCCGVVLLCCCDAVLWCFGFVVL